MFSNSFVDASFNGGCDEVGVGQRVQLKEFVNFRLSAKKENDVTYVCEGVQHHILSIESQFVVFLQVNMEIFGVLVTNIQTEIYIEFTSIDSEIVCNSFFSF
jgi:hypothetical protein